MSGVSDMSSVSQRLAAGLGEVIPPVMLDLVELAKSDVALAKQCARGYYSAYAAYIRAISGVTSVAASETSMSDVGSEASDTSRGRKKFYPRKLSPVPAALVTKRLGTASGYCYLSAFKPEYRGEVSKELGPEPSFFQLLAQSGEKFVSERGCALKVEGSVGKAHVGNMAGKPFFPVLRALAQRCNPVMSRGAICYQLRVDGGDLVETKFQGSTSVGIIPLWEELKRLLPDQINLEPTGNAEVEDLLTVVQSYAFLSPGMKERMRLFEALGDTVLAGCIVSACLDLHYNAQQQQEARSACTSNTSLSRMFASVFDQSVFSVPAGVSVANGKVGANFLEAIIGLLFHYHGLESARALVQKVGVLSLAGL